MKNVKSTLESFKENELSKTHKLHVYGGVTDGGTPGNELDDEEIFDENGDPVGNAGPKPTGGGGPSSGTSMATLGNSNTGGSYVLPQGGK